MQADPTVLAQAAGTLARLKRRAGPDRPTPTLDQFADLAELLTAAEEIATEARAVRSSLAQAVARHRALGDDVPTHAEIGAAFGTSRQTAEVWSRST